jgi:hypothetical protein
MLLSAELQRDVEALASLPLQRIKELGLSLAEAWILREVIFEQIRRDEYPAARCRIGSVYLFRTEDDARAYRQDVRGWYGGANAGAQYLHLTAADIPAKQLFEGDTTLLAVLSPYFDQNVANFTKSARRYWLGEQSETPLLEILAPPNVVRVDKVIPWGADDSPKERAARRRSIRRLVSLMH